MKTIYYIATLMVSTCASANFDDNPSKIFIELAGEIRLIVLDYKSCIAESEMEIAKIIMRITFRYYVQIATL